MSDMEKAYSDYMSKKSAVWSQIAELYQGLYLRVEPHLMDIFKAGYTAAQSQSGWVPIADIPEEWKDGRLLDIIIDVGQDGNFRIPDCKFMGSKWFRRSSERIGSYRPVFELSDKFGTTKVTHAMLPPPSPKEQG